MATAVGQLRESDHLQAPIFLPIQPAPGPLLVGQHDLLADLGFGLDLSSCAATGTRENLAYVSPRSGRAVSAEAGKPYLDRLFAPKKR